MKNDPFFFSVDAFKCYSIRTQISPIYTSCKTRLSGDLDIVDNPAPPSARSSGHDVWRVIVHQSFSVRCSSTDFRCRPLRLLGKRQFSHRENRTRAQRKMFNQRSSEKAVDSVIFEGLTRSLEKDCWNGTVHKSTRHSFFFSSAGWKQKKR